MRLDFRLLVIDDQPDGIADAIEMLRMSLEDKGFRLEVEIAEDISVKGIDEYCRAEGRNIDLAIVDYKLGEDDIDGALAAQTVRNRLKYTDIIFYSTSQKKELAEKMAKSQVEGVFLASRGNDFDEVLWGVAETIIGKAVDLNHMRGIAIAEAAEMDLLMEEILVKAFSSKNDAFLAKGRERVENLVKNERENLKRLEARVDRGTTLDIISDNAIFGSTSKWQAVHRLAEMVLGKTSELCLVFAAYETDIIGRRNILAHARAVVDDGVTASLRAIRPGRPDEEIDEAWMVKFRSQLTRQRDALNAIAAAVEQRAG